MNADPTQAAEPDSASSNSANPDTANSEPVGTETAGSEAARFEDLFDAHFEDLWRFSRRRTESAQVADDVVAEVFAVAWRRRDDLPNGSERLWLFGVARNVVANTRRSEVRSDRLRTRLTGVRPSTEAPEGTTAVPRLSLEALTNDERETVQLRYWDELAVSEIAELLECSPNAVSLRLHKARRKLLDDLDQASNSTAQEGELP